MRFAATVKIKFSQSTLCTAQYEHEKCCNGEDKIQPEHTMHVQHSMNIRFAATVKRKYRQEAHLKCAKKMI